MSDDGWELRMSRRAAERERRHPLEPADACQIGDPDMPPGHAGHHEHVQGNAFVCSCGEVTGCFSFAPDPRLWSGDPAEVEAAGREHQEWAAGLSCSICGATGVTALDDFRANAKNPAPELSAP